MSRFISVVWLMQFLALLALSVVLLTQPMIVPQLLDGCTLARDVINKIGEHVEELRCLGVDLENAPVAWMEISFLLASIQLLVPFLLVLAAFSLQAFMREDLRVRRQMARIFALTGSVFVYLLVRPPDLHDAPGGAIPLPSPEAPIPWRIPLLYSGFGVLVFLVASNLALALWPLPRTARRLSGSADTRPSQLWILWLIQGLAFCLFALFLWKIQLVGYVVNIHFKTSTGEDNKIVYGYVLNDIQQLAPPLFLSVGLFSFMGMRASREWGWRAFSRLFVLFYVAWFLVLLFVWQQEFESRVLLFLIPLLLLLAGNLKFWRKSDTWFAEEVGEGPDGWVLVDLLVGPLMLLKTVFTRKRALYARGVAARGTFLVNNYGSESTDSQVLEQDFFRHNQRFEARVRFSSQGQDDAALAPRGVALQLSAPGKGSFDMMLATGAFSAAENIVQFSLLHLARALGGSAERLLWKYQPHMREGVLASLRRAPDSYAQLHYYSQTVRFWVASNGTRYLVRYRLVPEQPGSSAESGIPNPGHALAPSQRLPDERRPLDYLKQEMKRRLEGPRSCTLRLEAQFHSPRSGESNHWFNPAADWSTDEHPWRNIGQLVLEEIIPDEQAERLCFNPANVPPSLGIPISQGLFDYRSIADSEKRIHRRLQKTRAWMIEAFGPPTLDTTTYDLT